MPVYERTKMCKECPFRAKSLRGWLGPLTVEDLEKRIHGPTKIGNTYIGDVGELICHMDINRMSDEGKTPSEIGEQGQQCVGMIRYTNSICKVSRVPEVEAFQDRVAAVKDQAVIPPFKLREHHSL